MYVLCSHGTGFKACLSSSLAVWLWTGYPFFKLQVLICKMENLTPVASCLRYKDQLRQCIFKEFTVVPAGM